MFLFVWYVFLYGIVDAKNFQISELMAEPCQCVPPHMCIDNDLAVNGQGLLDIRLVDGECENAEDICCDNIVNQSLTSSASKSLFNTCGYETPMRPRIFSDESIVLGEVPWTTAILVEDPETKLKIFRCGSSLIHPQVVMTAAHCLIGLDKKIIRIRAGEVDSEDVDEILPHQDRFVRDLVIHEQFNVASLKNDIALIFLNEPFMLSANIRVICLPTNKLNTIGTSCVASGWGAKSFVDAKQSPTLKKVHLPLMARTKCLHHLRNTRLGPFFSLHRSFICAGGESGKDTCTGDGGSPLVCPLEGHSDRFVQMGIVSWGIGCGSESPGVYVNINLFTSWIDEQILKRKLDVTVYKYK